MKIFEEKKIKQIMLKDMVCDFCGESCRDKIDLNFEFSTLYAFWGYGSEHDDEILEKHFCEKCTYKIIERIENEKVNLKANENLIRHLLGKDLNE